MLAAFNKRGAEQDAEVPLLQAWRKAGGAPRTRRAITAGQGTDGWQNPTVLFVWVLWEPTQRSADIQEDGSIVCVQLARPSDQQAQHFFLVFG